MRRRSPASGPDRTQKLVGAISFGRSQEHHGATDERTWCRGAARARVLRVDHPILVDVPLIAPRQAWCAMPVFIANRFSQAKTDGQLSLRPGMEPQQLLFHQHSGSRR